MGFYLIVAYLICHECSYFLYIMYVVLHVLECEIQTLFDRHEKGLSTFNYF